MLIKGNELIDNFDEKDKLDFLLEDYIPFNGLSSIIGIPDVGKSLFCKQLAIALSNRMDIFFGKKLKKLKRKILYVSTEDNAINSKILYKKQSNGGCGSNNIDFVFDNDIKNVLGIINTGLYDVAFFDSLNDLLVTSNTADKLFLRKELCVVEDIFKDVKTCCILVHHLKKSTKTLTPNISNIIGSDSFVQKVRSILALSKGIGDYRYLSLMKGNYSNQMTKDLSLRLKFNSNNLSLELIKDNLRKLIPAYTVNCFHEMRDILNKSNIKKFLLSDIKKSLNQYYQYKHNQVINLINDLIFYQLIIPYNKEYNTLFDYEEEIIPNILLKDNDIKFEKDDNENNIYKAIYKLYKNENTIDDSNFK